MEKIPDLFTMTVFDCKCIFSSAPDQRRAVVGREPDVGEQRVRAEVSDLRIATILRHQLVDQRGPTTKSREK
jgi:hypothetical protein